MAFWSPGGRLPGPRVVLSNAAHVSEATHHHLTETEDGDQESEAHTTAHDDFETAFADAQRLAGGKPTGGMEGSPTGHSVPPNGPGKGPSHVFPWRNPPWATTDRGWQIELNQTDQPGRGYRSQLNEDDPEPAMFRRYVESHHDHFEHHDVCREAPSVDRERANPDRDTPPQAPHGDDWFWPPGLEENGPAGLPGKGNNMTRFQTQKGTWLFMPFGTQPAGNPEPSNGKVGKRRRRRNRHGQPPSEPSWLGGEEQAESEAMTVDPLVEPSIRSGHSERAPAPRRRRDQPVAAPAGPREAGDEMQSLPSQPGAKGSSSATKSWTSAMGPQRGVKFRGGAPPQPPGWKYQPGDVRAFERYERKVMLWQMQIRYYMTRSEAGLMLYSSLTGEAEQQMEFADMNKIFHENGVQYILDQLKSAFQQKSVYVKRHVLHEYEHIYRYNQETLRGFINRYRRIEASLLAIGIDVTLTYDNEARGSRLLDRAKLTLEQQRMVLVGTGQRMDFDTVASALCMQFPEYRPAPPIAGKGDHKGGKGDNKGQHSSNHASSSGQQHRRQDGNGKFYNQHKTQRVYETVVEGHNEEADDGAPDEVPDEHPEIDENDQDQPDQDDEGEIDYDNVDDFEDLAKVLTVTAKKLAAMTQGRKFRNGPKKTIEQRKQESPCAACGELGHWAGDEQCKVSGGKGNKGKTKPTKGGNGKSDVGKKVFTVNHYTGFQAEEPWEDHQEFPHSVLVVFSTSDKIPLVSNMEHAGRFMILDTACQRSCCGKSWHMHHEKLLNQIENKNGITLPTFLHHQRELFQFGAGDPQVSHQLAHFPVGIDEKSCYLGASILDAGIPFLGSLSMMSKLGFIVDLPNQRVAISALACEAQLINVDGNMAIDILQFPKARHLAWDVRESELHDQEVNFINMSHDHAEDDTLPASHLRCKIPTVPCSTRLAASSSATSTFKTDLKTSIQPHGFRPFSGESMAQHGSTPTPIQQACVDSIGHRLEDGHGTGCSLGDGEQEAKTVNKNTVGDLLGISGSTIGKQTSDDADRGRESMQAPKVPKVRQRMGQVREMRDLLPEVEMERRTRRLEVGWILLQTLAAATCALDSNGWSLGAATHDLQASSGTQAELCTPPDSRSGTFNFDKLSDAPASSTTQEKIKASIDDILGSRTWADRGSFAGVRHSDGSTRDGSQSFQHLPVGRRRRLTGNINKNVKVLEKEIALVNAATIPTKFNKVDLMELYAGASLPTSMAPSFGLTSLQSFDQMDGYDLNNREVRRLCEKAQQRFLPTLLVIGFPCTNWNIFNENLNYHHRLSEIYEIREGERDGLRWSIDRCEDQIKLGNYYFFENCQKSRIWQESEVLWLQNHPDNYTVLCDAGFFDGKDADGFPIIKTYKILTNHKELAEALHKRLTPEQKAECRPLEGQRVTDSQVYPEKMVRTMLRVLRDEARRRNPLRFTKPVVVCYAKPLADEARWRAALDTVRQTFGTTTTRSINLRKDQPLYQEVATLVPWEIVRIQIAATPTLRRMPRDIPFTHRCSILLYVDNTVEIDDEDVSNIEFPKQRFARPVQAAIFVFGMAENEMEEKQDEAKPDVHIPGLRTDVRFPGLPPNIPREVQASIARLHVNSGHASKKELIRLFTMHGAISSQVLSCLEHLECGTCKRSRLPQQPRPAAVPVMSGQFGDRLQIDRFWVRDLTGYNHCLLGAVDMATSFQQGIRLVDFGSEAVYEALRTMWLQPFGHPLVIESDDDRCFGGSFKEQVESAATHLLVVPAEAHWRIGTIERKNAILRNTMEKLIDEYAVTNGGGIDLILTASTQAINTSVTSKGRSPYQAVFGRLPRFPGDIFGDERALLVGPDHVLTEELRAQALRIIAETRASSVIRRALLRKTANSRQEAADILPGSLAAYWRWSKKAKGKKRGGYILGRLLSHDTDGKSAWLHNGNSVVQVTYEQLRPAFGIENWTPSSQDIQVLKDGAARLQRDLWQDERGPAPPEDEEPLDANVTLEDPYQVAALPDLVMPMVETGPLPATPAPPPPIEQPPQLPLQQQQQLPDPNPMVYSPTFNQSNTQTIHQHFQQPYNPDVFVPQTPRSPRSRSPPIRPLPSAPTSLPQPILTDPFNSHALPPPANDEIIDVEALDSPREPTNMALVSLMTTVDNNQLQDISLVREGWDGSQPMPLPRYCSAFRVLASEILDEPVSSDTSDDEQRNGPSDLAALSRQERKALDREIPWRVIVKDSKDVINAYIEANKKEFQSWLSWGSIIALSASEAKKIKSDPVLKYRCIPARNAYRDKNRGIPPLRPKCRTVVLGCLDPDIKTLDRTAPTPHRMTEAILIQIAASGINGLVQLCPLRWTLWAGDVSTAFLQGEPEKRQGRLFMRPPRDQIQAMAQTFPADLYEVCGNLYGFCNAPRTWNRHVVSQLTTKAKLQQHHLDQMMFYGKDKSGKLQVVLIVHVDDFLVAYRSDYQLEQITSLFKWGSQTTLDEKTNITFRGKQIKLVKAGEKFQIQVTQTDFIEEMSSGCLQRGRLRGEPKLSPDEWKEYRSCAGSLQWLSGQTRPDVGATVSLSNRGSDTGPEDLKSLYECIEMTKATKDLGLTYMPIPFDRATFIVGYADSSWANAPGHKSQMGSLVLLTTSNCLIASTAATLIDWRSGRSPRVTRSTLASEANAMDDCVDRCTYANHFITELLHDGAPKTLGRKLRQLQVTDCQSLYDAVISPNPVLTEKRTIIQVRSIQEYVNPEDLRWTPTGVMWADALTKVDPSLLATFQSWLRSPQVTLVGQ